MRGRQSDRQDVALLPKAQELARDYRLTGPDAPDSAGSGSASAIDAGATSEARIRHPGRRGQAASVGERLAGGEAGIVGRGVAWRGSHVRGRKKAPRARAVRGFVDLGAGAGFEPATFRL